MVLAYSTQAFPIVGSVAPRSSPTTFVPSALKCGYAQHEWDRWFHSRAG